MRLVRLTLPARADIDDIRAHSIEQFGAAAEDRYSTLIEAALINLRDNPTRAGVQTFDHTDVCAYHLQHARRQVPVAQRVGNPRHYIVFRATNETLDILRVLHDAMDVLAHLPREDD